jgi:4-amino-4-deoxy-L-arabinose transferase-like glycosyltransferase
MLRFPAPFVAAFLLFAVAHACLAPIGENGVANAPDERAHVTYARLLAAGHIPAPSDDCEAYGCEWHHPPLMHALGSALLPLGERRMRALPIAIGALCVVLVWIGGRICAPDEPRVAGIACAFAALIPSHIAVLSAFNNDGLEELCCSAALVLLLTTIRSGAGLRRSALLGAAVGAACLTKVSGLLLLPVTAAALLLARRRGRATATLLRAAAVAGVIALAIAGWWYVRNAALYHDPTLLPTFDAHHAHTGKSDRLVAASGWTRYLLKCADFAFHGFWAVYGAPELAPGGARVAVPKPAYAGAAGVTLAAVAGFALRLKRRRTAPAGQSDSLAVLSAFAALVAALFVAFFVRYYQPQARYLYPAMLPICVFLSFGWTGLFGGRRARIADGILIGFLILVDAAFLKFVAPY